MSSDTTLTTSVHTTIVTHHTLQKKNGGGGGEEEGGGESTNEFTITENTHELTTDTWVLKLHSQFVYIQMVCTN